MLCVCVSVYNHGFIQRCTSFCLFLSPSFFVLFFSMCVAPIRNVYGLAWLTWIKKARHKLIDCCASKGRSNVRNRCSMVPIIHSNRNIWMLNVKQYCVWNQVIFLRYFLFCFVLPLLSLCVLFLYRLRFFSILTSDFFFFSQNTPQCTLLDRTTIDPSAPCPL